MTDYFHLFIANVLVLFSVVNPIGNSFVVNNNYLIALTDEQKKVIIRKVAFCAFWVCLVGFLVGKFLLALFGLSIPVIQIAGGAIICRNGWRFFMDEGTPSEDEEEKSEEPITSKRLQYGYLLSNIFYPLTFPMVIGAGTFSVLLTLAANASSTQLTQTLLNFLIVIAAIAVICILIYIIFVNTAMVQKYLGREGNIVVKKMSSFFTICIGLKIALTGFGEIAVVIFEKIQALT